ncbi:hypothetical protein ACB098_11G030300 [Castanea mollissima]
MYMQHNFWLTFIIIGRWFSSLNNIETHENSQKAQNPNTNNNTHNQTSPILVAAWRYVTKRYVTNGGCKFYTKVR